MKRHPSFELPYDAVQTCENGNGATSYTSRSAEFPGVICREIHVYARVCGEDSLWYEASGDPAREQFSHPAAALRHARSLQALAEESLIAELKRPKTFRYLASRLHRKRAVFMSAANQKALNADICCSVVHDGAMEHGVGGISVLLKYADGLAEELMAKGWIRL